VLEQSQLQTLSIEVRRGSVNQDVAIFQKNLFRNFATDQNLKSIFPKLETFAIKVEDHDEDLWVYDIGKHVAKETYSLNLGVMPVDLTLSLRYLPPPRVFGNFAKLDLIQCGYVEDKMLLPLAASSLREFRTTYMGGEGCAVGNAFTNKMLSHLPKTMEDLHIRSCNLIKVPCTFKNLPALRTLQLIGADFRLSNLTDCLPNSLEHLQIELGDCTEFFKGYGFDIFDMTGLPGSLRVFELEYSGYNKEIRLIGACPSALKTLLLQQVTIDKSLLPPHTSDIADGKHRYTML
jgi:hypothetical protein